LGISAPKAVANAAGSCLGTSALKAFLPRNRRRDLNNWF
jgi:hypothetical protein